VKIRSRLCLFAAAVALTTLATAAEQFPLRARYPGVTPISTADFAREIGTSLVVDVRSDFEFSVMHIEGVQHIDYSDPDFVAKLTAAAGGDKSRNIITYCNGTTCEKSYEAAVAAQSNGFASVRVYDAGIFEWARMARGRTLLFGKPIAPEQLISEPKYKARLLDTAAFALGAARPEALLIDVRNERQREKTAAFARQAEWLPMDQLVNQLATPAFRSKAQGKTLYIFDNVGKQVRWLQYALQANGYTSYFFLQDGMKAAVAR
jgi:rhodanese-related sulfurtransferase